MPRLPAPVARITSVRAPPWSVEKVRSPLPPLKFCWSMEVIAAVVVPVSWLMRSAVLKERREAVEVAGA